jgi:hypothetical protein
VIADNDAPGAGGFRRQGFGLSDLLLATKVGQTTAGGARWTSVGATPHVGALPRNSELTIVWENYELGNDGGSARYSVTLSLVRVRSGAGRIAARVLGAIASVARIDTQQDDRYSVTFDRQLPHAAAFADQITIALAETPPGTYIVTIEVTDRASGAKSSRTANLRIAG